MNDLRDEPLIIFDGACGTTLQSMHIPESAWQRHEGCNEFLNLSAPGIIEAMHAAFFDAGAMVVETNTFGANRIVLSEYGLHGRTAEINAHAVQIARAATQGRTRAWVAGSVGPTTKLPLLQHITVSELADVYHEQMRALVDAGVDLLIIETCQDLLQAKTAVIAALDVARECHRDIPVMVSITVEKTGTMLLGTEIPAVAAALAPLGVFSLGLNCATGPELMHAPLQSLMASWPRRVSCMPNAGIPQVKNGRSWYPLEPAAFAQQAASFVTHEGVSIVGGCCGTTPAHIKALAHAIGATRPALRAPSIKPSISSGYQAIEIRQEIPPLLIGERANVNGSKAFRERLLANDFEGALKIGAQQQDDGAHAADLCVAYAGRDEAADMVAMIRLFAQSLKLPIVIDCTIPQIIERAIKEYPGRCIINSINLEDGGANLARICGIAKRYGAALIALVIDEQGMAMTAERKLTIAKRIYDLAVASYGLQPHDLLFDSLTFTIGSGDASLREAAIQTLEGIRAIKKELPGAGTILGVSNVSFGLPAHSRPFLNSVFLHEAVKAGLDAAIVDARKIIPLANMPAEDRNACLDLIYNRGIERKNAPLDRFIARFPAQNTAPVPASFTSKATNIEEQLTRKIIAGSGDGVDDLLAALLARMPALSIINDVLVPAMRIVGDMFGKGELLLPFVLRSAEVMKRAVTILEPSIEKSATGSRLTLLLATVAGDVHDIGKNLADIIISNNGYRTVNLGIKVPAGTIIEKAAEHNADAIGLSGLLVKSTIVMQQNLEQFARAGLKIPVLLGGAALTKEFVARSCAPVYPHPVVYCSDAFAGLTAMQQHEAGKLQSTRIEEGAAAPLVTPGPRDSGIARTNPLPLPPFRGNKIVQSVDIESIFLYINEQALFRGRWGYRRGAMGAEAYAQLVDEKVRPLYETLKRRSTAEKLIDPRVAYGYFPCRAKGNQLVVAHNGQEYIFTFPRQNAPPHLCIADFFCSNEDDIVGFFAVTIGDRLLQEARKLFENNHYHDYLMLHGFGVEATDALAEYWHEQMRIELQIAAKRPQTMAGYAAQHYQGSRYAFGYPACPDLDLQRPLFDLLDAGRIGVTLTDTMEISPELSTSAIVVHHPQAKYFAV